MMKTTLTIITCFGLAGAYLHAQDDTPPEILEHQPDLILGAKDQEPVGNDIYGSPRGQVLRTKTKGPRPAHYTIGIQNDGSENDRIRFRGSRGDRKFRVAYKAGDRNITAGVVRGISIPLEAGESKRISAAVAATRLTKGRKARKALRYSAVSGSDRSKRDSALSFVLKQPQEKPGRPTED
jgi:hypothetical protein